MIGEIRRINRNFITHTGFSSHLLVEGDVICIISYASDGGGWYNVLTRHGLQKVTFYTLHTRTTVVTSFAITNN